MRITPEMFRILKLRLEGLSAYRIARELNLDPPMVYASLKAARANFAEAERMISELKALGWPEKLVEIETRPCGRIQQKSLAAQETHARRSEEIAIKLG